MKTNEITFLPKAYCGYSGGSRAYVAYQGRLTADKYERIANLLAQTGYTPGWKCTNVRIEQTCGGMYSYKEDGAGGLLPSIEVFHLSGDK